MKGQACLLLLAACSNSQPTQTINTKCGTVDVVRRNACTPDGERPFDVRLRPTNKLGAPNVISFWFSLMDMPRFTDMENAEMRRLEDFSLVQTQDSPAMPYYTTEDEIADSPIGTEWSQPIYPNVVKDYAGQATYDCDSIMLPDARDPYVDGLPYHMGHLVTASVDLYLDVVCIMQAQKCCPWKNPSTPEPAGFNLDGPSCHRAIRPITTFEWSIAYDNIWVPKLGTPCPAPVGGQFTTLPLPVNTTPVPITTTSKIATTTTTTTPDAATRNSATSVSASAAPPEQSPTPVTRLPPTRVPVGTPVPGINETIQPAPTDAPVVAFEAFAVHEDELFSGLSVDFDIPCDAGAEGIGYRTAATTDYLPLLLPAASVVRHSYTCVSGGGIDVPATARRASSLQTPRLGSIHWNLTLVDPVTWCDAGAADVLDYVTSEGAISIVLTPEVGATGVLTRRVRVFPQRGVISVAAPDVAGNVNDFTVAIELCAESFDTDASLEAWRQGAFPVNMEVTGCDIGAYFEEVADRAALVFPTAQLAHFLVPALPRELAVQCAGERIVFSPGPALAYASGLSPKTPAKKQRSVPNVAPGTKIEPSRNDTDQQPNCSRPCVHGMCEFHSPAAVRMRCVCTPGWSGDLCDVTSTPANAAAAVVGAGVVSWILQVAVGGSVMVPVHSLTTLQVLYRASTMECAPRAAVETTSRLWYLVSPTKLHIGANEASQELVFLIVIHASLLLLHLAAVAVAYFFAGDATRSWPRAAAKVYFPNASVIVLYCFTVPLISSVGGASGAVLVAGGVYTAACFLGLILCSVWFARTKMLCEPPFVEFLTVNLNNSDENANRVLRTPETESWLPGFLQTWLPSGFWTCRHLVDRSFLRCYSSFVTEYSPSAVRWYPFFALIRLFALGLLVSQRPGGCAWRLVVLLLTAGASMLLIFWQKPFVCSGSNVAMASTSGALALSAVAILWASDLVPLAMGILGAMVLVGSCWFLLSYLYMHRLYGNAKRKEERENEHAPMCVPPLSAMGHAGVWRGTAKNEQPPERDARLRRWVELRGAEVAVFASRSDVHAEFRVEVDLAAAKWFPPQEPRSACRLATVGSQRGNELWLLFLDEPLEAGVESLARQWELAVQSAGESVAANDDASEVLLGRRVARVPETDRRGQYDFFGSVLQSTYGEYRHCLLHESSRLSEKDLAKISPGFSLARLGGPSRLLMHCVEVKRLGKQQAALWTAELAVLRRIRHPYIVEITDAFEAMGALFWTMPYCSCGSLQDRLATVGVLPERAAAFFTAELLLGLEHLHENNLYFRNLSPADVLFDGDGHALLSDPGLPWCRIPDHKVSFQAPEVIENAAASPSSDLWALGAVSFAMLHGRAPFLGKDLATLVRLARNTQPSFAKNISKKGVAFMRSLMKKKRPEKAKMVRRDPWFASQGVVWSRLEARDEQPPVDIAGENQRLPTVTIVEPPTSTESELAVVKGTATTNPLDAVFAPNERPSSRTQSDEGRCSPKRLGAIRKETALSRENLLIISSRPA
eukprot:TRINITY_DN8451_c0_g1_i1.p1 TRINITY_DN8451_c0_g1~~TRINITY_DN8451_c0_g1_i1.p1  ORF type:complete len:1522 (+),score=177.29 TRINITY_DN8451_c0_g1_i1:97-4662(+)